MKSDNRKMVEISSLAEKVVAIRQNVDQDREARKFEMNSSDTLRGHTINMQGNTSSASLDSELDEASYLSWVEKLKEASRSTKDDKLLELGNRKNLSEERHLTDLRVEAARKKAEEKKSATWEAHGYRSLSVEEPIFPDDVDSSSDAGSVHFVYGDCTNPSTVSHEPAIIFSCVDDSGNWGRGGMFNALSKLSNIVPEFKDLHLGELHLIKIDDNDDQQTTEESKPLWVALAVAQSYNPSVKSHPVAFQFQTLNVAWPKLHSLLLRNQPHSTCHVLVTKTDPTDLNGTLLGVFFANTPPSSPSKYWFTITVDLPNAKSEDSTSWDATTLFEVF